MGIEKEGSKTAGGYVGGFFHLFDWSAKSRKKLFSSKSDVPERSKQGKRSDGSVPATRLHLMYEDEAGAGSIIRGSDYSCASSVTDDDGCGARAPGVVARLMGLDSMPTSSEPGSTPFFDTQSLRDVSQRTTNFDYYHDTQIMYSGSLLSKEDGPPRNFAELKPQKVLSRPIEKFQTEILPPRSAKSIPITHHKLLSPIKNPGFVPSKTAAHIMEAAAKILEPTPPPNSKTKMPMVGSSSVPLKVRDLKERLEVAQKMPLSGSSAVPLKVRDQKEKVDAAVPLKVRDQKEKVDAAPKTSRLAEVSRKPSESNAVKYLKGQSLNKSWNGSVETTPVRAFPESDESSPSLKNKEKSISLAIQAKVNVQRRGGLNSSNSRALTGQKEHSEVSSSQTFKSQPNTQKTLPKKSILHNTGVLKQNNQKQNCPVDRDRLPSNPSVSTLQSRKVLSGSPLSDRHKTSGKTLGPKVGSRKFGLEIVDDDNGNGNHSARNNTPRKKRSIDGNLHVQRNQVFDGTSIQSNRKTADSNPAVDRSFNLMEESKKKGMDVVSFTFTSPMTRSMPASETSGSSIDNRCKRLVLDADSMKLSSAGYNVVSGDALSSLLEQKLKELTKSIETSCQKTMKCGSSSSSASMLQDLSPTLEASTLSNAQDLSLDKLGRSHDSDLFFTDPVALRMKHRFQGVDMMGDIGSKLDDSRKVHDYRDPSPISVLEPSFSLESSSSLESAESCCTEGSKACSSVQEPEISGLSFLNKSHYADANAELSDSASSTSTITMSRQHTKSLTVTHAARSTKWELQYVTKMLCNLEWMFQDFALGRATEVIYPQLFDRLERHKEGTEGDGSEARLERKVVFDCVSECLDLRCKQFISGGYKTWVKGVAVVRRNEWLAEEVCKEISGWRGMEDCMVDELVDKDMSCQYGRWLDFEVDAFGLGVEIEGNILNSLVDEVVFDFLGL